MVKEIERHPLEVWRQVRNWAQAETSRHFGIAYATYRGLVRGFRGVSYERAKAIEERSEGMIPAAELMAWHSRNRRGGGATTAAKARLKSAARRPRGASSAR